VKDPAPRILSSFPLADAGKAKTLQKEICDLKAKLSQAQIQFEIEERKINPDPPMGMGYGTHMGDMACIMGLWSR
jgi:hypothetical protein